FAAKPLASCLALLCEIVRRHTDALRAPQSTNALPRVDADRDVRAPGEDFALRLQRPQIVTQLSGARGAGCVASG
ncbi:MAG: hypothetical protein ACRD3W_03855, partial [Terriglobales bacterium]